MWRIASLLALLVLELSFPFFHLKPACAQANRSGPVVVLEATETIYGLHSKSVQLLVRISGDGKVEREEWDGKSYKRRVKSVSVEQVSSIKKNLYLADKDTFHARMGPYNTYTDTSSEVRVRVFTSNGSLTFTVINPWPCELLSCSFGRSKPLPKDVKAIICEVGSLRTQLAGEPVYRMCKPNESPK
jgi:hypothetical protein